jgi:hypothetical protein
VSDLPGMKVVLYAWRGMVIVIALLVLAVIALAIKLVV